MKYLILHKVSGEPAFDIAEQIQIGDEEGWIIPTSGHRAYPYEVWPLNAIPECLGDIHGIRLHTNFTGWLKDWPDHYQTARKPEGQSIDIGQLLSGLVPKVGKFLRRA